MQITPEQRKKLEKIAKIIDGGNVAIAEHLLEIEDKIPDLDKVIGHLKGKDGIDGKSIKGADGYTPRKGIDYKDGENYILTEKDKKEIAKKIAVPVVKQIFKTETIIKEQPVVKEVQVAIPLTTSPEEIRNLLEVLQDDERLDAKAIRGLEEYMKTAPAPMLHPVSLGNLPDVSIVGATTGQVLTWNGTYWYPKTMITGISSVTGLNTDNTDPANPIVKISVDGVTITGTGTPGSPLVGAITYTLPTASASVLGGIKVGSRLTMTGDVLSADIQASGDVHGPSSAVDSNFAAFDTTTGKLIKDSGKKASDFQPAGSYEVLANKATDFSTINNTLYPTVQAVNNAITTAVTGLLDYRGTYDASTNVYPSTGGSGTAGAILKGDLWIISVNGVLGGNNVYVGDLLIAMVDTPAQTSSSWNVVEYGLSYIPENVSNKDITTTLGTSDIKYPSQNAVKVYVDTGLATKQPTGSYEVTTNKVTSLSGSSTDVQYPSAKLVYDQLATKQPTGSYEVTTNKSTSVITDGASDVKYPSVKAVKTYADTKKYYHGVVARPIGASSPLPDHLTTTTFTLGATANPISYYFEGTLVNVTTDQTTTLSGAAGLYFIYFNAATGTLSNSTAFPGLTITSNVLVAYVYWNGSNYGVVYDERHAYDRDCEWHNWAHNTIGTRYGSGLVASNNGGTGAGATFAVTSGNIYDEDINFAISTVTSGMTFYQTGATTYTFDSTLSAIPYKAGTGSRPTYVDNTFTLQTMTSANNRYINIFVYATNSIIAPIQMFAETVTAAIAATNGYTSLANARAIPFPNLSAMGLSPEMKPIYRFIARADGVIQAIDVTQDDYRTSSSIPFGGGTASTTAAAVSFVPYGNIASTNVQAALQELDDEKVSAVSVATANGVSGSSSGGTTPDVTISLGAITPSSVNAIAIGNAGSNTNTFIGNSSLAGGTYNTAIGVSSLQNNSGSNNVALGEASLNTNTTGSYNTACGILALSNNSTGSRNVAVGYYAGKYETGDNAFYIDNQDRTNTAGDKAGAILYGTFNATPASQTLKVNAALTVAQTIAASNLSGTNTGNQNIFASIPVSGQTTVTTASTTQALTFVAGTGMTITTDNTAKSVTFTSAASSGNPFLLVQVFS